jgi:hypothetical protein
MSIGCIQGHVSCLRAVEIIRSHEASLGNYVLHIGSELQASKLSRTHCPLILKVHHHLLVQQQALES